LFGQLISISVGVRPDRLEHADGPHARKMLERSLEQVQQAEAINGETDHRRRI
jgi:hypothetical protein